MFVFVWDISIMDRESAKRKNSASQLTRSCTKIQLSPMEAVRASRVPIRMQKKIQANLMCGPIFYGN